MSAAFHARVKEARRLVVRAMRLGFPHDAAAAVVQLRDDLADTGRRHTVSVTLLAAMEDAGARESYAREMVEWLVTDAQASPFSQPPRDRYQKPVFIMEPDGLPRLIESLESALADARLGLYWQAGKLVWVGPVAEPDRGETVRAVEVNEDLLIDFGTQAATWTAPGRENTGDGKTVNCPKNVARGLLARRGIQIAVNKFGARLPVLAAIGTAPTLREDGSLVDLPGFDPDTGLYLHFGDTRFPAIPDAPTFDEAADALERLGELLAEVNFVDAPSRAVALSAILTALVRPSLPAAPMHAITATTFGTGKSYLADIVACIATGRTATPLASGSTDEEFEKRLGAALMAGPQIISIDNVTRAINGDLLNQILTQERVAPRRLGSSENVEIKSTATVLMNGNNLSIPADMTRRVLLCSLDARTERPELAERDNDPLAMIRESRGDYVAAGLTILRAYIAAGRPVETKPLGGFEAWSGLVRGALIWLGQADPVDSMDAVRAADPHRQAVSAIMAQWGEHIGDARVTISEVITAALASHEFRESLLAVAGERGAINGMRLGKWLGRNKGRIIDGQSFQPAAQRKGVATWRLDGAPDRSTAGNVLQLHDLTALLG